ncbi:MAG: RNA polymerase sigma factor [Carboxylicivirga sp.]|jgi:RNA polymerase sigma-70 factor (ECF subfamily)|nr:RNA polymerase sigma factor [Carboxylicivirga sp.]MCT4647741.1 RNA polymerase sigma factor [Carboxylicivirga sp.]
MDLKRLIYKCIGKDERAFEKLYHRYAPVFKGVCRRYASSLDEADDILQEAYVKIFNNLDQLKDTSVFESWGKRIVINTAIQFIRKKKADGFQLDIDNIELPLTEEQENTAMGIMAETDISDLIKLMDHLPEGYKTILNLYAVEDYSHNEIAEMLNIKEATSRSQYFKAKKAFQQVLLDKVINKENEKYAV